MLPFEQRPQSESAVHAVEPSGHTLPQSATLVQDLAPMAHVPPVVCAGQSLDTEHCWVVALPAASLQTAYAAHGVDVLEQALVP